MPRDEFIGLCFDCRWRRATTTRQGSVFFRCLRAESDARFVRYPALPVRDCPGYEEAMLFVVLVHYSAPLPDVDAVRPAHVEHLERYAREGVIRAWARRDPATGGVLVATAPNRAALEAILAEDPYIRAGVARTEIVAFNSANVRGLIG